MARERPPGDGAGLCAPRSWLRLGHRHSRPPGRRRGGLCEPVPAARRRGRRGPLRWGEPGGPVRGGRAGGPGALARSRRRVRPGAGELSLQCLRRQPGRGILREPEATRGDGRPGAGWRAHGRVPGVLRALQGPTRPGLRGGAHLAPDSPVSVAQLRPGRAIALRDPPGAPPGSGEVRRSRAARSSGGQPLPDRQQHPLQQRPAAHSHHPARRGLSLRLLRIAARDPGPPGKAQRDPPGPPGSLADADTHHSAGSPRGPVPHTPGRGRRGLGIVSPARRPDHVPGGRRGPLLAHGGRRTLREPGDRVPPLRVPQAVAGGAGPACADHRLRQLVSVRGGVPATEPSLRSLHHLHVRLLPHPQHHGRAGHRLPGTVLPEPPARWSVSRSAGPARGPPPPHRREVEGRSRRSARGLPPRESAAADAGGRGGAHRRDPHAVLAALGVRPAAPGDRRRQGGGAESAGDPGAAGGVRRLRGRPGEVSTRDAAWRGWEGR